MDTNLSTKDADGASSDEEEAFESADEGEEGLKSSNPPFAATSSGVRSSNSTSEVVVDMPCNTQFSSDDSISSETKQVEREAGEVVETAAQKIRDMDAHSQQGDIPCEVSEDPCRTDEVRQSMEISHKTHVEEDDDSFSQNDCEDKMKADKENPEVDVENKGETAQHSENGEGGSELKESGVDATKVRAGKHIDADDNQSPSQASGKSDKEPICDDSVETPITDKVDAEKPDSMTQKPAQGTSGSGGGWGWSGWTSMLSQATASVTSGLTSVIETVETSLGVPDPEEMARKVKQEEKVVKQKLLEEKKGGAIGEGKSEGANNAASESFFASFGVSSLTNVVQTTAIELGSSGLDALEFIGKKTMNVIAEGDPGLRQKREKLTGKGPSLSQILKEAKEESNKKAAAAERPSEETGPTVDLFNEFDKFQGLAHLEALEMLSRDCEAKLESRVIDLTEDELAAVKPLLRAVEEVFHMDDNADDEPTEGGDFMSELAENVKSLNLPFTADKLVATQEKAREWIKTCVQEQDSSPGSREGMDIYATAVSNIAELTARTVELFHKLTELLLHQADQPAETSSLVRAQSARKMADVVLVEISVLATHFAGCLNTAADDSESPDSVSSLITTLYLDSSTSADYLRNSLKLLRPVLQFSSLNEKNSS